MSAYYNEFDPFAAAWLRELIKAGHIAPGDVDERSIEDVKPSELLGYTQCHFFAGIGVWSAALRGAGWPDDRPVWTGSCPCQPFSQAGQGKGVADERHLWPAWFHLIKHGKGAGVPVFGEQVASDDGRTWLDIVQADLEGEAYTFRAVDICSAGFGSPNIRNRFFFDAARRMGNTGNTGLQGSEREAILRARWWAEGRATGQPSGAFIRLADPDDDGPLDGLNSAYGRAAGATSQRGGIDGLGHPDSERAGRVGGTGSAQEAGEGGWGRDHDAHPSSATGGLGDSQGERRQSGSTHNGEYGSGMEQGRSIPLQSSFGGEGAPIGLADPGHIEHRGRDTVRGADGEHGGQESAGEGGGAERIGPEHDAAVRGAGGGLGHTNGVARGQGSEVGSGSDHRGIEEQGPRLGGASIIDVGRPGPTNGFWRSVDWLYGKDGKWRPVEPGTFPLASRAPNRVGRLRGYGNAINKEVAQGYIKAVMLEG